MRRLLARNETLVGLVLAAVCLGVAWAEPSFLSLSTLFDLLRNGIHVLCAAATGSAAA